MRTLILKTAALILSMLPNPLLAQGLELGPPLVVVGELRLQENDQALVEAPGGMIPDPRGGWIYWDRQAEDVRLFTRAGELLASFGGPGQGPGEFSGLTGVTRVEDGRIVAIDRGGRVSVWSGAGDSLLGDFVSGAVAPYGLAAAGDGRIIVLARSRMIQNGPIVPTLQLLDLDSRELENLVFDVPLDHAYLSIGRSIENPAPVVYEGSVYVALATFDSLWAVSLTEPHETRSVRIQSNALNSTPDPTNLGTAPSASREWLMKSSFSGQFFRMPRGGWIMMTWGVRPGGQVRGIVRFDDDGRRIWELEDTLRLIAVDPESGDLLLWDREGLEPARMVVARETS